MKQFTLSISVHMLKGYLILNNLNSLYLTTILRLEKKFIYCLCKLNLKNQFGFSVLYRQNESLFPSFLRQIFQMSNSHLFILDLGSTEQTQPVMSIIVINQLQGNTLHKAVIGNCYLKKLCLSLP